MVKQRISVKNRLGNVGKKQVTEHRRIDLKIGQKVNFGNRIVNKNSTSVDTNEHRLHPNDIRFKLIAKKRNQILDARDKLAQISKQTDARTKLNAKKKMPTKKITITKKVIPAKNRVKTGIETISSGSSLKSGTLTRTISGSDKNDSISGRTRPLPNNPNVFTIKNDQMRLPRSTSSKYRNETRPSKSSISRKAPALMDLPTFRVQNITPNYGMEHMTPMPDLYHGSQQALIQEQRRNLELANELLKTAQNRPNFQKYTEHQEVRPTQLRITTTNNRMAPPPPVISSEFSMHSSPPKISHKRPLIDDEYRPTVKRPSIRTMSDDRGFKVMITNLHNIVSVDDIKELFGCIGPLSNVRMIREGIAEVSFVRLEDAYRSVELYHNRQLDRLPMNVTLITKRAEIPSSSNTLRRPMADNSGNTLRRPMADNSGNTLRRPMSDNSRNIFRRPMSDDSPPTVRRPMSDNSGFVSRSQKPMTKIFGFGPTVTSRPLRANNGFSSNIGNSRSTNTFDNSPQSFRSQSSLLRNASGSTFYERDDYNGGYPLSTSNRFGRVAPDPDAISFALFNNRSYNGSQMYTTRMSRG